VKRILMVLLGLSGLTGQAFSQITADASVETMYDDNVNNNFERTSSPVTNLSLQGGYLRDGDVHSVLLSYTGGISYFSALPTRSFQTHGLSISYARALDEEEKTLLNTSAAYSLRLNREDLSYYDHGQFSFQGALEHHFSEETVGKAGYTFRYVRFAELGEFNYLEHYAYTQLTTLLPTSTTLILEADLGSKGYLTANQTSAVHSSGRGNGQSGKAADGPSVTQLIGMARLGQPIVEGTGLSLTLQYQVNLQKESRYILTDAGAFSDDDVLEDHYGYEGPMGSLMLTQLLPGHTRARISYSLQDRTYANRPALDLAGMQIADTRRDTRSVLSLQVTRPFEALGVTLGLSFDRIINNSNDQYYNYSNNALSFMISYGL
jgi:hypothetical protein